MEGETFKTDELPAPFLKHYSFKEIIGRGGTSIVVAAENIHDHKIYACKFVSRKSIEDPSRLFHLEHELRIHSTLKHFNIVGMKEVIYDKDYIIIVLEYCQYGDMLSFLLKNGSRSFALGTAVSMIFQILKAIDYLHSKGIAHRDIKPENIFLDKDMTPKLGDFGCCEDRIDMMDTNVYNLFGTLAYAAPEVLDGERASYDPKRADIWAAGITFFSLLTLRIPPLKPATKTFDTSLVLDSHIISKTFEHLFEKCWETDPKERATTKELLAMPLFFRERARLTGSANFNINHNQANSTGKLIVKPNFRKDFIWKSSVTIFNKINCPVE